MKNFFKHHADLIINTIAGIFIAVVVGIGVFTLISLTSNLNTAFNAQPQTQTTSGFDLQGAKALDLKGLVQ